MVVQVVAVQVYHHRVQRLTQAHRAVQDYLDAEAGEVAQVSQVLPLPQVGVAEKVES
jgi:hypothetical protein